MKGRGGDAPGAAGRRGQAPVKAPGARLHVQVKLAGAGGSATFRLGGRILREIDLALGRSQLNDALGLLRRDLHRVKLLLGKAVDVDSFDKLNQAFRHLQERGSRLALQLFNHRLPEVVEIFRGCYPLWERDPVPGEAPPLVEVMGDSREILPLEFLPLFNPRRIEPFDDLQGMLDVARRFVGFSTFVRRHLRQTPIVQDRRLAKERRLPLKLFHREGLRGARREVEFFRSRDQTVELRGPWPDQEIGDHEISDHLASQLFDPGLCFDQLSRQSPDQVQHFACHCAMEGESSEEDFLELAHHQASPRKVRVKDLELRLVDFRMGAAGERDPLPLVFVNACSSAVHDPTQVASFHHFFVHQNGNRGFIGTETRVPDPVAATFSRYFYDPFLQEVPLGQAIHEARWKLLRRHQNPLGLLYTVYADPEIRVEEKAPAAGREPRRRPARGRKPRRKGTRAKTAGG